MSRLTNLVAPDQASLDGLDSLFMTTGEWMRRRRSSFAMKDRQSQPAGLPAKPTPASKPAPKPLTPEQLRAAAGAEFVKYFGQQGTQWFAEGLTFDQATRRYGEQLIEQREAAKSDAERVTGRVAKVFAGKLSKPAPTQRSIADESLPRGLAKFAKGIKLPDAKPAS
jgi:hypothetical protein